MSENGANPGGNAVDLEAMTRQWQELMMDSWGKMTKQVVGSDSFAAASSSYMDWALSWQKQMRNNTGQFLESLEFPKRSDIARLSKQIAAVELRVADMEDRLDKMTGLLGSMSEAMQRMVEHTIRMSSAPATAPASESAPAPVVEAARPAPAKKPAPKKKA